MPGVEIWVTDQCAGCGDCTQGICFVDAIYLNNGHATINERCRGCGLCVEFCPMEAIEIIVHKSTFVAETILKLSSLVNID